MKHHAMEIWRYGDMEIWRYGGVEVLLHLFWPGHKDRFNERQQRAFPGMPHSN
jgi:hypothetical protein